MVLQNHIMKDLLPSNLQVVFPDYPRVMHLSTQSEKERKKDVEICSFDASVQVGLSLINYFSSIWNRNAVSKAQYMLQSMLVIKTILPLRE